MGVVAWVALRAEATAGGGLAGGATFAVAVGAIVVSVLGGYYVTRWVLALAARTGATEAGVAGPGAGSSSPREPRGDAAARSGPSGLSAGALPPVPPPPGASAVAVPQPPDQGSPLAAGPTGPAAVAALRGGTWIGILERLAVTGLILVGYPAGIAILVAIKGLGRYPELQANPGASERFVVGTLASIVWAAGLGVLGLWWIG